MQLAGSRIAQLAANAGLSGDRIDTAVAVALAESSGNPDAVGDGGDSVGLWQINMPAHRPAHPHWTEAWLKIPANNATAMAAVSENGTNWQPWTMFRNGEYREHLGQTGGIRGFGGALGDDISIGEIATSPLTDFLAGQLGIEGTVENVEEFLTAMVSVTAKTMNWIIQRENWFRVAYVVTGGIVVAVTVAAIARPVIDSTAMKAAKKTPVGKALKAVS